MCGHMLTVWVWCEGARRHAESRRAMVLLPADVWTDCGAFGGNLQLSQSILQSAAAASKITL